MYGRYFVVYIIWSCLVLIYADKDHLPQKKNIGILADVGRRYHSYSLSLLRGILDGISLAKYRISFFTTSSFSSGILQFQSRRCILDAFKNYTKRYKTIGQEIKRIYKDTFSRFPTEPGNLLILSNRGLSHHEKLTIGILKRKKNIDVFFIDIKELSRSKKNLLVGTDTPWSRNIRKVMPFINPQLIFCKGMNPVHDECNRLCQCENGKMVECARVRKEFSSMSKRERLRYISTYKELSTNEKYRRVYNHYISYHPEYFDKGIHERAQFFPWHRKYLLGFENLLRLIDCRVTIPFWNWAVYSDIAWSVTPFYHMWHSVGGFGGNGNQDLGYCVERGVFNYRKWVVDEGKYRAKVINDICDRNDCFIKGNNRNEDCPRNSERVETGIRQNVSKCIDLITAQNFNCLRRRFADEPPSYRNVYETIKNFKADEFDEFQETVLLWHDKLHVKVGGQMGTDFSSIAPEFWLHHCVLDAFWDKWQRRGEIFEWNNAYDDSAMLLGFLRGEYLNNYVHNNNLGGCGVRILYHNTLPHHPDGENIDDNDSSQYRSDKDLQFHSDETDDDYDDKVEAAAENFRNEKVRHFHLDDDTTVDVNIRVL